MVTIILDTHKMGVYNSWYLYIGIYIGQAAIPPVKA